MAEGFIGEIRMFGGNFAPRNWAFCDGQIIPTANNDALFSLLGNVYGGDGRTSFGLPDLRGRIPVHSGNEAGPGLQKWPLGQRQGSETYSLKIQQMPGHTHSLNCSTDQGDSATPYGGLYADNTAKNFYKKYDSSNTGPLYPETMTATGEGEFHGNMMPSLGVSFIISLKGIYPSRN